MMSKNTRLVTLSIVVVACALGLCPAASIAHTAKGERWMVATGHPIATDAAADVFRHGGNAVDAAVAAALTLGVVDGNNSGIGGGCLILVRSADGNLTAIDGREMAPAAAHKDMFLEGGTPMPDASQTGPLAVGVPGALAAYTIALERCGTKELPELLAPGIKAAEEGFSAGGRLARAVRGEAQHLNKYGGARGGLLHDDGTPIAEGEKLVQRDLANTYRAVAEHGIDWFYRGPFAQQVDEWMAANSGILTAADFAAYEAKLRQPLLATYRDYKIIGFPPPSSGGVHVAQVLNILEQFPVGGIEKVSPLATAHLMIEAFKLAFADRAHWLGDADFAAVPRGLASKEYAKQLAEKIEMGQATDVASHGTPSNWKQDVFDRHTTHIAAADADGNWVAITATVNTTFGSKVIVPGTGVVLNNEMDDFSIYPGVPNAFGLVGAQNNSVAPGKRPLSSMSPTIVLNWKNQPILTVGAAGGPKIITQVVLTIVRQIDLGQSLPDAVAGPRFHHQWRPGVVSYEKDLAKGYIDGLRQRGHELDEIDSGGVTQAIAVDNWERLGGASNTRGRRLIGVSDPRGYGKAAGE